MHNKVYMHTYTCRDVPFPFEEPSGPFGGDQVCQDDADADADDMMW